jgi:hypothetical protein
MDRGHRYGVYGDIGDAVTHRSLGAESYNVLRHTFYFFTLGTSPASIDPAHFRRASFATLIRSIINTPDLVWYSL